MLTTKSAGALIQRSRTNQRGIKMKVKITRQTFVKGELAEVGDVINVDEKDFFVLVRETKKAIEVNKSKPGKKIEPEPEKMTPPKVENREKDMPAYIAKRSHKKKKR